MSAIVAKRRRLWLRTSVPVGNLIQLAGMGLGFVLLRLAVEPSSQPVLSVLLTIGGWLGVYLSSHAIAHWGVGCLVGIRFKGYGVGGSDHAERYPPLVRDVMAATPFFGALTDK